MATTLEYIGNNRYHDEIYYGFYGEDGTIGDNVAPGTVWKLKNIRIHASVPFVSVETLVMKISAGLGSAYNTVLYSANFSDYEDLFIHYSEPLTLMSDDQLLFELSMVSGTNIIGFQFETWAARG